jgi:predicted nucleotidyltransferase
MNNRQFTPTTSFLPEFTRTLPETCSLLLSANLVLHPGVSRVILHGSRGLAGKHRVDSDIDLSLIVDLQKDQRTQSLFHEITRTTLDNWQSPIEVDLAIIYDLRNCKQKCFEQKNWDMDFCTIGGTDCFGLYKIQKGFNGFVTNAGIHVQRMYPCLKIWQREETP